MSLNLVRKIIKECRRKPRGGSFSPLPQQSPGGKRNRFPPSETRPRLGAGGAEDGVGPWVSCPPASPPPAGPWTLAPNPFFTPKQGARPQSASRQRTRRAGCATSCCSCAAPSLPPAPEGLPPKPPLPALPAAGRPVPLWQSILAGRILPAAGRVAMEKISVPPATQRKWRFPELAWDAALMRRRRRRRRAGRGLAFCLSFLQESEEKTIKKPDGAGWEGLSPRLGRGGSIRSRAALVLARCRATRPRREPSAMWRPKQQVRGTAGAAAAPLREPPALPAPASAQFCSLFVHRLCKQRERGAAPSTPCCQHLPQRRGSGGLAEDGAVPVPPLPGAGGFPGHSQPRQSRRGLPASLSKRWAAGFQGVRTPPREGCLEKESGSRSACASPPRRGRLREAGMGGRYREGRKGTAPDLLNKSAFAAVPPSIVARSLG